MGRIVFEAAEPGRVVRWCDDDPVGETPAPAAVVVEHGMRDYRGRRVSIVHIDHDLDAICREHLQRARKRRVRQSVCIDADKQRSVNPVLCAVATDRLGDCEDVCLIERVVE